MGPGGAGDHFAFRSTGVNTRAKSVVALDGISPDQVFFYVMDDGSGIPSELEISKAETVFGGVIFAPGGVVEHHDPATFAGRIVASDIDLHSDFDIAAPPPGQVVPEPSALLLLATGLAGVGAARRRRAEREDGEA